MRHFGHEQFFVGAHDRGARVAHRLCLDSPRSVMKVCLMDIAPTLTMYRQSNQEFATKYVWWFFLIQAAPVPEHFIGLDPQYYLGETLSVLNKTPGALTPEAVGEYRRCFCCTSTIHATCEDFRAAAEIGLKMDEADDRAGKKIVVPVHAFGGQKEPSDRCGTSLRPGGRERVRMQLPACPLSRSSLRLPQLVSKTSASVGGDAWGTSFSAVGGLLRTGPPRNNEVNPLAAC
jgi:pimeloyl-ACP methyl ester carboxylesterase